MAIVIQHHHYIHLPPEVVSLVRDIKRTLKLMAANLDRITSEVEQMGDAADSAVALLQRLAQLLRESATDPAAIEALADDLDAKGSALAAAVVANTPADPEAPEEG